MKFRLTVTAIREYEVDPCDYPDPNIKAMLKLDRELVDDDPDMLLDHPDTKREIQIEHVN